MNSINGLVGVWVKSRNEFGNNYESQGFVSVLKKDLLMFFFGNFGRKLKKMIDDHVGKILTYLGGD